MDRERDFECQRSDAFYQQSADGVIDVVSDDTLAYRYGMLDAVALADVFGHKTVFARVVPNRHPAPADSTDHQSLQQRWALARRTLAAIGADRLSILPEAPQVLFVLLPGDVAGMSILEQHPLFARQLRVGGASIGVVASPTAAINERTRITRIVKNVQGPAVGEFGPHQVAFVRPLPQPPWKQKPLLAEGFDSAQADAVRRKVSKKNRMLS